MFKSIAIASSLIILLGCQSNSEHTHNGAKEGHEHSHGHANHHMNKTSFDDLVKSFESPERDEWQKPTEVIRFLGDLKNGRKSHLTFFCQDHFQRRDFLSGMEVV